jgi:hypothetical protein
MCICALAAYDTPHIALFVTWPITYHSLPGSSCLSGFSEGFNRLVIKDNPDFYLIYQFDHKQRIYINSGPPPFPALRISRFCIWNHPNCTVEH